MQKLYFERIFMAENKAMSLMDGPVCTTNSISLIHILWYLKYFVVFKIGIVLSILVFTTLINVVTDVKMFSMLP